MACGNISLLEAPIRELLVIRSRFSKEDLEEVERRWIAIAKIGGVLVSPFINPKEKKLRNKVLSAGGSIIEICDNGFPERYKITDRFEKALMSGRYLQLGPGRYETQREPLSRERSMAMNRFAASLCTDISPLIGVLNAR